MEWFHSVQKIIPAVMALRAILSSLLMMVLTFNALWAEAQAALAVWNAGRSKLVDILTYPVTNEIESVPQVGEATFELASEFGEPQGERLKIGYFQLGFDFADYDRATLFHLEGVAGHGRSPVQAINNALVSG